MPSKKKWHELPEKERAWLIACLKSMVKRRNGWIEICAGTKHSLKLFAREVVTLDAAIAALRVKRRVRK